MFSIAVQVAEKGENGWTKSYGLPTFFLEGAVQGIMPGDTEHAEKVARAILEPLMKTGITLYVAVAVL